MGAKANPPGRSHEQAIRIVNLGPVIGDAALTISRA